MTRFQPLRFFVDKQPAFTVLIPALMVINGVLAILPAFLGGYVVLALTHSDFGQTWRFAVWMLLAIVASGAGAALEGFLATLAGERFGRDVRIEVYGRLLRLPLAFVRNRVSGEMMNRVDNDVDLITGSLVGTIEPTIASIVGFAVTGLAMLLVDWRLALVTLCTLPLFWFGTQPATGRFARLRAQMIAARDALNSLSAETLSYDGLMVLKSARAAGSELARFRGAADALIAVRVAAARLSRLIQAALSLLVAFAPAIVLIVGAWLVLHGMSTIATLIAFLSLQPRLFGPVSQLASLRFQIETLRTVADRVGEAFGEPEERDADGEMPHGHELAVLAASVSIDGRTVVPPVSFVAREGRTVAIVGRSGSGKTSLVLALLRFIELSGGAITVGGVPLERIPVERLRELVALVPQRPLFFTRTLRENLLLAAPDATPAELDAALAAADARGIVAGLPDGLDTIVGAADTRLSGGEQQRLAIARAILAKPKILVLDEATSALDRASEDRVLAALGAHPDLSTVVHVTHRLDRLPHVDLVVELGADDAVPVVAGALRATHQQ